jgi:4-hydroxy-2-oxoheptanedioate aldolase
MSKSPTTDGASSRPSAARLRAKWEAGETTFGLWAAINASITVELGAAAGYDYVCIDLQHGLSDEQGMVAMLQGAVAAGATPLVRPMWNEPGLIMRELDLGAAGVIVPLVSSRAEAARAVDACRYPPVGTRSYGPSRAELRVGSSAPEDLAAAALCFVMIETRDGLDHVEEIAATPGLDGLYIGPSDLSLALGLSPGVGGPELEQAIARILEVAHAHELIAGMHCHGGQAARDRAEQGFDMVTVAVDSNLFRAAITQALAEARG